MGWQGHRGREPGVIEGLQSQRSEWRTEASRRDQWEVVGRGGQGVGVGALRGWARGGCHGVPLVVARWALHAPPAVGAPLPREEAGRDGRPHHRSRGIRWTLGTTSFGFCCAPARLCSEGRDQDQAVGVGVGEGARMGNEKRVKGRARAPIGMQRHGEVH